MYIVYLYLYLHKILKPALNNPTGNIQILEKTSTLFYTIHPNLDIFTGSSSPLSWRPGDWSPCSGSCKGHQSRTVSCFMTFTERDKSQEYPESFCESAGLIKPKTIRRCGGDCPRWINSPWSPCNIADCLSARTGWTLFQL